MQTSSQNKMTVQPIAPLMFRIGLPIVLSMILQAAYNVVDSAYLARMTTGGEDALTALSLAFPVQLFMVAVSIGTGVGTNALLAKLLGLVDQENANRTVGNAQTLAIILSAVFMLFSLLGVRPYVYSQSAGGSISPEVLDMAIDYLHICCGIPFGIVLFSVYEKVLQATGRSLYSTIAQIAGAVVNIILDPIMIFGLLGCPAMGIRGAAIATVIGQLIGAAAALWFNRVKNPVIHVRLKGYRFLWQDVADIYRVGLPTIVMQAIGSVMTFAVNSILLGVSSTAVAFFGIYYKLQNFLMMPVNGLGQAAIPVVGFNYGSGQSDRVKQAWKVLLPTGVVFALCGTAVFLLFPAQLLGLFSASNEMLAFGVPALRIISVMFLFAVITILCGYFASGLGNGVVNMIGGALRQLVVLVPCLWLLIRTAGIDKAWFAFWVSEVVACAYSLWAVRKELRNKVK